MNILNTLLVAIVSMISSGNWPEPVWELVYSSKVCHVRALRDEVVKDIAANTKKPTPTQKLTLKELNLRLKAYNKTILRTLGELDELHAPFDKPLACSDVNVQTLLSAFDKTGDELDDILSLLPPERAKDIRAMLFLIAEDDYDFTDKPVF